MENKTIVDSTQTIALTLITIIIEKLQVIGKYRGLEKLEYYQYLKDPVALQTVHDWTMKQWMTQHKSSSLNF